MRFLLRFFLSAKGLLRPLRCSYRKLQRKGKPPTFMLFVINFIYAATLFISVCGFFVFLLFWGIRHISTVKKSLKKRRKWYEDQTDYNNECKRHPQQCV